MSEMNDPSPEELTDANARSPKLAKAQRRWKRCQDWESTWRPRALSDWRFKVGDDDNGWQWPAGVRTLRERKNKPCLTLNIVRQHCLQITNEARLKAATMDVIAAGGDASQEAATIWKQLIKRAEVQSQAPLVYSKAADGQVGIGVGYWRWLSRYEGEGFDQELYMGMVPNPLNVYVDPDAELAHGGDANFAFIFDRMPRELFREAYPQFEGSLRSTPLGGSMWADDEYVTVSEYFEREQTNLEILSFVDPLTRGRRTVRANMLPPEVYDAVADHPRTKRRTTEGHEVKWSLWVGEEEADSTTWPGEHIPLVRVLGEEDVVEGIMDRKGHVRYMKSAQHMYNYGASAQVEYIGRQFQNPYVAAQKAIEGHELEWERGNVSEKPLLTFNHLDDEGNLIPEPKRQEPPQSSPAFEGMMTTAFNQLKMVTGQWDNQLGMQGNERTGAAIGKRQERSDVATYHFEDNYNQALGWSAQLFMEAAPHFYDTNRVLKIAGEDGIDREVEIDPAARGAYLAQRGHDGEVIRHVLNPRLGRYQVFASKGNTASQRQNTVEALTLIITQAPQLTQYIGDLLLAAMDFKQAQEAAQRLRRMVPPQAMGQGPSPQEEQLKQQVVQLTAALSKALQAKGLDRIKLAGKDDLREIEVYKAETDRISALKDILQLDPQDLQALLQQTMQQAQGEAQTLEATAQQDEDQVPTPPAAALPPGASPPDPGMPSGAMKAPDGQHYMVDPSRPGKYLQIQQDAPQAPAGAPQ